MSFTSKMRHRVGERLDAVRSSQRPPTSDRPFTQRRPHTPIDETLWFRTGRSIVQWAARGLRRPRVRLVVIGLILILIAAIEVTSSVWTLPLVIVGALMVLVAWIGARLDGRIGIVWGENGTEFEMRARLKPYRPAALEPGESPDQTSMETGQAIDGEAHTMPIDVAELKALIAAIEAADAHPTHAGSAPDTEAEPESEPGSDAHADPTPHSEPAADDPELHPAGVTIDAGASTDTDTDTYEDIR